MLLVWICLYLAFQILIKCSNLWVTLVVEAAAEDVILCRPMFGIRHFDDKILVLTNLSLVRFISATDFIPKMTHHIYLPKAENNHFQCNGEYHSMANHLFNRTSKFFVKYTHRQSSWIQTGKTGGQPHTVILSLGFKVNGWSLLKHCSLVETAHKRR